MTSQNNQKTTTSEKTKDSLEKTLPTMPTELIEELNALETGNIPQTSDIQKYNQNYESFRLHNDLASQREGKLTPKELAELRQKIVTSFKAMLRTKYAEGADSVITQISDIVLRKELREMRDDIIGHREYIKGDHLKKFIKQKKLIEPVLAPEPKKAETPEVDLVAAETTDQNTTETQPDSKSADISVAEIAQPSQSRVVENTPDFTEVIVSPPVVSNSIHTDNIVETTVPENDSINPVEIKTESAEAEPSLNGEKEQIVQEPAIVPDEAVKKLSGVSEEISEQISKSKDTVAGRLNNWFNLNRLRQPTTADYSKLTPVSSEKAAEAELEKK